MLLFETTYLRLIWILAFIWELVCWSNLCSNSSWLCWFHISPRSPRLHIKSPVFCLVINVIVAQADLAVSISLPRDRLQAVSVHSELWGHIDLHSHWLCVWLRSSPLLAERCLEFFKKTVNYLELPLKLHTEVKSWSVFVRAPEGGMEEEQARLQMLL